VTIAGDCSIAGLGLSLTDRQTLISNINLIFHCAATIKFDENLKLAIDINVHGTKDVIDLGKEMKHLKVSKKVKIEFRLVLKL
jgi:fatty acyl-CoA reductase